MAAGSEGDKEQDHMTPRRRQQRKQRKPRKRRNDQAQLKHDLHSPQSGAFQLPLRQELGIARQQRDSALHELDVLVNSDESLRRFEEAHDHILKAIRRLIDDWQEVDTALKQALRKAKGQ